MADLHDLLAREAERHCQQAGSVPPFEPLLLRSRRRRATIRGGSAVAAVGAVTAAIVIPNAFTDHSPANGMYSGPTVTSGVCAGLTVTAVYRGQQTQLSPRASQNKITLNVGDTLRLTAAGPCEGGVVYTPFGASLVFAAGSRQRIFNRGPVAGSGAATAAGVGPVTQTFAAATPGVGSVKISVANLRGGPSGKALPVIEITATVESDTNTPTTTPSPPPPVPDACGPWSNPDYSETGKEITAKYGEIRNCGPIGNAWFITTLGVDGSNGMLGIYRCKPSDGECLDGRTDHPFNQWSWISPRGNGYGGVKYVGKQGETLEIYVGRYGYMSYNLDTGAFQ